MCRSKGLTSLSNVASCRHVVELAFYSRPQVEGTSAQLTRRRAAVMAILVKSWTRQATRARWTVAVIACVVSVSIVRAIRTASGRLRSSASISAQLRMRRATIVIVKSWTRQAARARWTVAVIACMVSVSIARAIISTASGRLQSSAFSAQLTRRRAAVMAILAHQAARARWTFMACCRTSSLVSLPNS